MQTASAIDHALLIHLNHWIGESKWTIRLETLPIEAVAAAAMVGLWFVRAGDNYRFRSRVLILVMAELPTYAVARLLQAVFHRPRPFLVVSLNTSADPAYFAGFATHEIHRLGSFPSDHSAWLFLTATFFFAMDRKLGIVAFVVATVYSILRIALGVHWPSDAAGGALLGIVVAVVMLRAQNALRRPIAYLLGLFEEHSGVAYGLSFFLLSDLASNFEIVRRMGKYVHLTPFH